MMISSSYHWKDTDMRMRFLFSYGVTYPLKKGSNLDGAISMAQVQGVPQQVSYLVNEMKTTYKHKIDIENDWKLLTLFIGANNMCSGSEHHDADYFESHLRAVLQQIHDTIPRVFVNVMTLFNISQVWDVGHNDPYCVFVWDKFGECPRLTSAGPRAQMDIDTLAMNKVIKQVVSEWEAKNSTTFHVVVQPGVEDLVVPSREFLSRLDCFHPNEYADAAFALALWNNMNQPQGQKSTTLDIQHPPTLKCPGPDDYIM
eukprot:TRINITY_DN616_c0_g4_i4.p1 TRINITY_DN616_c0_g4~~TRINITY_DN616_c0_g4_i4.p1  ORF type:complete len:257 (+),score=76.96 TRINITY_DN616_c0_g4_i4:143-913(+)